MDIQQAVKLLNQEAIRLFFPVGTEVKNVPFDRQCRFKETGRTCIDAGRFASGDSSTQGRVTSESSYLGWICHSAGLHWPFWNLERADGQPLERVTETQPSNIDDLQQAYQSIQDALNFQPGDRVKVVRAWPDYVLGWEEEWVDGMDRRVGRECLVQHVDSCGIALDGGYSFPWFALQLVRPESRVESQESSEPAPPLHQSSLSSFQTKRGTVVAINKERRNVGLPTINLSFEDIREIESEIRKLESENETEDIKI